MRFIDRDSAPRPEFVDSSNHLSLKSDQEEFYRRPIKSRRQKRSPFETHESKFFKEIEPDLRRLFSDKCAFCERQDPRIRKPVSSLFRPHADAMNLDGTTDPDHYWWLAYEWGNQYLFCSSCASIKINRFPVVGERSGQRSLTLDQPYLLDPCTDRPEQHLRFFDSGLVTGVYREGELNRGGHTIDFLALNRKELLSSRKQVVRTVQSAWARFTKAPHIAGAFTKLLQPQQRHLGMVRQLLARQIIETESSGSLSNDDTPLGSLKEQLRDEIEALRNDVRSVGTSNQRTHSIPSPTIREATRETRVVYVSGVEIRNFKGIDKLRVIFPENTGDQLRNFNLTEGVSSVSRWKMLLGENGTGKSSVLQAVALAIAWPSFSKKSEAELQAMGLTSERLLRDGSTRGHIKVTLSDSTIISLSLTTRRISLRSPVEHNMFVRGYGATRLTRQSHVDSDLNSQPRAFIDNLFNPLASLINAEQWLLQLDDSHFDIVARAIKDLVQSPEGDDLKRVSGHVQIGTHRFDRLSDGYRSLVAVACDLMAGVPHPLSDLRNAAGVAIIDELDSHLHPRWKMRVVARLRDTFPSIQFIASTHDPLCLRGLTDGQVAVFQRDIDAIRMQDTDLPSPAGLRVDQLLTSPHFGMNSTIEPELDDLFNEYYRLLAIPARTHAENLRYESLQRKVDQHRVVLGYTRRDQLVYEVIDECLSRESLAETADARRTLRDDTKKRILSIWNYGLKSDGGAT